MVLCTSGICRHRQTSVCLSADSSPAQGFSHCHLCNLSRSLHLSLYLSLYVSPHHFICLSVLLSMFQQITSSFYLVLLSMFQQITSSFYLSVSLSFSMFPSLSPNHANQSVQHYATSSFLSPYISLSFILFTVHLLFSLPLSLYLSFSSLSLTFFHRVSPCPSLFLHSNNPAHRYYLATDPVTGQLYVSDTNSRRIYRPRALGGSVEPQQNVEVMVGTGEHCLPFDEAHCGDGGPATDASLAGPKGRIT